MGNYASQLAVDYMQAYYKVVMKNCVDGVSIHAIEEQLIENSPVVFNSEDLKKLADPQVANLTSGEREEDVHGERKEQ
ncbi:hypothetical protein LTR22_027021 [Elasticomyces elasticus]|nr:hypothetical protein LTR22_027021 [Elasticomyces elasticus]